MPSVTSTGTRTSPTRDRTMASSPSARPRAAASSGWSWAVQRGLPFTSTDTLCIQELLERRSRRPISTKGWSRRPSRPSWRRCDVGEDQLRGQGDHAVGRAQHVGQARLEGAEVDAVRVGQEHVEGRAVGVGAEPLAVGAGAQQEVEDALRAPAGRQHGEDLVHVAAVDRAGLVGHAPLHHGGDHQVVDDGRVGGGARRPAARGPAGPAPPTRRAGRGRGGSTGSL